MKKTRVAIIGCGKIANAAHGPSYAKNPDVEIAYCIDILPERAEALARTYGDPETKAITDYREMLRDPSVSVVSVCVPNFLHAPITIDCLDSGKNVLCEKPAGLDAAQATAMAAACARRLPGPTTKPSNE